MAATNCPGCGAPVIPGSLFCNYCGKAVASTSSPLPSSSSGGAPPSSSPTQAEPLGTATPPPRKKRSRLLTIVIVVFVIAVLVAAVFIYIVLTQVPPIQVSEIDIWAPDNACGLSVNPIVFDGFNGSTGASQALDFGMPNFNSTACVIHSVTTNTSGFVLSGIQVPLTIPAGSSGTSMNITIQSPGSDYSGGLNLVLG
jgi:hypothetical protein